MRRLGGLAADRQVTVVLADLLLFLLLCSTGLGVDSDHLSPHSETLGAFHFIIEPNTKYDLWIDDFAGQPF